MTALKTVYHSAACHNGFYHQTDLVLLTWRLAKIFWQIWKEFKVEKKKTRVYTGTIYRSGICKIGAARAVEGFGAAFSQVISAVSCKLRHFENSLSLWKLVQTRSTSISCSPFATSVSSPDTGAFSLFSKPTLLQVKPLILTISCTCFYLQKDHIRYFNL